MCIVEIRPGNGGEGARLFGERLSNAISAWAARQGHKAAITTSTRAIALSLPGIAGAGLTWLTGLHRLQHVPDNERSGRRHTSFATIVVLDEVSDPTIELRSCDLKIDTMRGHGRGGQRRNKVETACRVTHIPTGLTAVRMSGRSQAVNVAEAKADVARQLAQRAAEQVRNGINQERQRQAAPVVAFTHSAFRDEVVCHKTGQRWKLRDWAQGRLS